VSRAVSRFVILSSPHPAPQLESAQHRGQAPQRLAAVADRVFFLGGELGGGLAEGRDQEQRIVPETALSAGRTKHLAFDFVLGSQDHAALRVG
jgi:hypothetical protein